MILTYYCIITMIIIAYLLGSIPSAVWIGKKYYGIDIREHGSKNAGTTNMLRVLGRRAALPVFLLDFLKGFVAVTLTEILKYDAYINDMWLINIKIIAVFAAVLGHIFPIFAGFRGGKGVATLVFYPVRPHPFNHQIYYIPHPRNRQEKFKRASLINSSEKVSNYVILV